MWQYLFLWYLRKCLFCQQIGGNKFPEHFFIYDAEMTCINKMSKMWLIRVQRNSEDPRYASESTPGASSEQNPTWMIVSLRSMEDQARPREEHGFFHVLTAIPWSVSLWPVLHKCPQVTLSASSVKWDKKSNSWSKLSVRTNGREQEPEIKDGVSPMRQHVSFLLEGGRGPDG